MTAPIQHACPTCESMDRAGGCGDRWHLIGPNARRYVDGIVQAAHKRERKEQLTEADEALIAEVKRLLELDPLPEETR